MILSPVLNILGLLTTILAAAMLIPMCFDLYFGSPDWQVFALSSLLTAFVGVSVWLATSQRDGFDLGLRQAFLLTNGSWISIGIFGALPFMFSELDLSLTDAMFESVSGITTTGSTVLQQIEMASPGILIWRALLQWLGGVGIIVMAMAVLPMLSVGGMQLFRTESFDTADKVVPRAAQLAGGIGLVYAGLTASWAIMLSFAGMSNFDAIAHAMTTIATGGYSTRTASIAAFDSVAIEWIVIAGMIVGSLPFAHYLAIVRGGWKPLLQDPQVRWFLALLASVVVVLIWYLSSDGMPVSVAIRQASFNAVSIMTGTGLWKRQFLGLGRLCLDAASDRHVHRRMWRVDDMRHQGVPAAGSGDDGAGPDRPPAAPACGDPCLLQPPAGGQRGHGFGDGVLLPLHPVFCRSGNPAGRPRARLHHRAVRRRDVDQQCRARAWQPDRRRGQFRHASGSGEMDHGLRDAAGAARAFHRAGDAQSRLLAPLGRHAPDHGRMTLSSLSSSRRA